MQVDQHRQQTNFYKKANLTQSRQYVNYSAQEQDTVDTDYRSAEENDQAYEDDVSNDSCNFLGVSPSSHSSNRM